MRAGEVEYSELGAAGAATTSTVVRDFFDVERG